MQVNPPPALIDPELIEQIQQFSLRIAQAGKGGRLAEQKTSARGQGLEFADYKPYVAGDELRTIDWHVYRRLGKLFVRVFEEQQNLPVYMLLDHSSSMFVESPSRIHAARQAALALGAIALQQQDAVRLIPFSDRLHNQHKNLSGKHQLFNLANQLNQSQPENHSDLAASITEFANYPVRQGLVVLLSDFFNSGGIEPVIDAMSQLRHSLLIIQITQPWDADPTLLNLTGDIRFQDAESSDSLDLQLTPALIKRYQQAYLRFNHQINQFADSRGAGLLQLNASEQVLPQLSKLFGNPVVAS